MRTSRGREEIERRMSAIWAEVLDVPSIGADDDFFALGGTSLAAVRLAGRTRETFAVDLAADAIFATRTLSAYAALVRAGDHCPDRTGIARRRDRDALAPWEATVWAWSRYDPGAEPIGREVIALDGPLDVAALEAAFSELVRRHEALRTVYREVDHRPRARVLPVTPFVLPVTPLSARSRREREQMLQREASRTSVAPLDDGTEPPWRARLLRFSTTAHALILMLHEIVCDAHGYGVLLRDLSRLYNKRVDARAAGEDRPVLQYRDARRLARPGDTAEGRAHWARVLADVPLAIPPPFAPKPGQEGALAVATEWVPEERDHALAALAQEEAATAFMAYLGTCLVLLHRCTGATRLAVRSSVANRPRSELEDVVGLFARPLPLYVDVADGPSFRTLLQRVRDAALTALHHADQMPAHEPTRGLAGVRALTWNLPGYRLADERDDQLPAFTGLTARVVEHARATGHLHFEVQMRAGRPVELVLTSTVASRRELQQLARDWRRLLGRALADPGCPIGALEIDAEWSPSRGTAREQAVFRGLWLNPWMQLLDETLARHPGVRAAATCWDATVSCLVAAVVPQRATPPARHDLDDWVQAHTSGCPLPGRYVALDALPTHRNARTDRRTLVEVARAGRPLVAESSGGPIERELLRVWRRVLRRRRIDVDDNFFAVGGTLVLGIELARRAEAAGVGFAPALLLTAPTIAELAERIDGARRPS